MPAGQCVTPECGNIWAGRGCAPTPEWFARIREQGLDSSDAKRLVANGYDKIAEAYQRRFGHSLVRARKLRELAQDLPPRARVLDLGCGAGVPVAHELIEQGFTVTGVDGSARQIELARRNVPEATFIQADMTSVAFPDHCFDAVSAFYSITHVPRDEHAGLLGNIAAWLAPGGWFVASFGTNELDGWTGEWLGATMFFSHHEGAITRQLVLDAGLVPERSEVLRQDSEPAEFLWITARKPSANHLPITANAGGTRATVRDIRAPTLQRSR